MKFESMPLRELIQNFRFADLLDIALIAILVYSAILWLRRAHSRFVALGIGTLICLYLAARLLGMYMTLFVFQLGVTVILIALIVIFQEEIRRGFERIALLGPFSYHRRQGNPLGFLFSSSEQRQSGLQELLVETALQLAATRRGALIVIKGKEPLDRHLSGGVDLEGRLSPPLIYSIFDPHSPGHDGALIIEGTRGSKFCVHLPLSTSVNRDLSYGTRHTAALGLSERSDALVVVVSEERGSISVAEQGAIRAMDCEADLRATLGAFLAKISPVASSGRWWRHVMQHPHLKALSIGIAAGAWLFMVAQQRESGERTFTAPVVYRDLPEGWLLEEPDPLEARVTVAGPLLALERVRPDDLALEVDVSQVHRGTQKIPLGKQNLSPRADLSVQNVEPSAVQVIAHSKTEVILPIKPLFSGRLPEEFKLRSVRTNPITVRLVVREDDRTKYPYVRTEAIDLTGVKSNRTVSVHIALPAETRLADGEPYKALVTLDLEERKRSPDK